MFKKYTANFLLVQEWKLYHSLGHHHIKAKNLRIFIQKKLAKITKNISVYKCFSFSFVALLHLTTK